MECRSKPKVQQSPMTGPHARAHLISIDGRIGGPGHFLPGMQHRGSQPGPSFVSHQHQHQHPMDHSNFMPGLHNHRQQMSMYPQGPIAVTGTADPGLCSERTMPPAMYADDENTTLSKYISSRREQHQRIMHSAASLLNQPSRRSDGMTTMTRTLDNNVNPAEASFMNDHSHAMGMGPSPRDDRDFLRPGQLAYAPRPPAEDHFMDRAGANSQSYSFSYPDMQAMRLMQLEREYVQERAALMNRDHGHLRKTT